MKTLNIGAGKNNWGDYKIDLYNTPITTHVLNVDKQKLPFKDNTFDEIRMLGVI